MFLPVPTGNRMERFGASRETEEACERSKMILVHARRRFLDQRRLGASGSRRPVGLAPARDRPPYPRPTGAGLRALRDLSGQSSYGVNLPAA